MTSAELIAHLAADIAQNGDREIRVILRGGSGTMPIVCVSSNTSRAYIRVQFDGETL